MTAVRVGAFVWDVDAGSLICDDVVLAIAGVDPAGFDGRIGTWTALIHPDDAEAVRETTQKAVSEAGPHIVEYRLRRPDGRIVQVESRGQAVRDGGDGGAARIIGTVWDMTHSWMARDPVVRALRNMNDGFFAVDEDWRLTYINLAAERVLGQAPAMLGRVMWEVVPEIAGSGLEAGFRHAMAENEPMDVNLRSPRTDRWYHVRVIPVPNGLTVFFNDIHEQQQRGTEEARARKATAERSTRITELTRALSQAVSVKDVVNAVADHVLRPFGASGLIIQELEGDRLRPVGSVGYDADFITRLGATRFLAHSPAHQVLLERSPQFVTSVAELAEQYPEEFDEYTAYPKSGRRSSWAFVPLIASGRAIGCWILSFDEPHPFSEEERTLLTALSGLIAQAFERARLYDTAHNHAQELQSGMLPPALPALPAVTAAARFLPTSAGAQVGGDWYDVIPLSAGRVALVIGDVMGHGVSEAVTMGRLRTAVHTLAALEMPPDELLAHLNEQVSALGDEFYATCLYAVYDPANGLCTFARAGHPAPAVVHPDGSVRFPELALDPPLGAATPPFDTVEMPLPEGSLLVMYTDGLIESRTRDLDDGMTHLARTLTSAVAGSGGGEVGNDIGRLNAICDTVTSALLPDQQTSDDAALLLVSVHRLADDDIATWPLPSDAVAASQARRHTREQLSAWHLDDLAMTTELLVSELVGNVVRHAKGPVTLRLLHSDVLVCEVSDGSLTTPHIRRASETDEGGRGLQLVEALSHRWGARYTSTGKSIWTEQLIPSA